MIQKSIVSPVHRRLQQGQLGGRFAAGHGANVGKGSRGDRIPIHPIVLAQFLDIGQQAKNPDRPGNGGGFRPNFRGRRSNPIASRGGHIAHGDNHRLVFSRQGHLPSNDVSGGGAAAGTVNSQNDRLNILVFAQLPQFRGDRGAIHRIPLAVCGLGHHRTRGIEQGNFLARCVFAPIAQFALGRFHGSHLARIVSHRNPLEGGLVVFPISQLQHPFNHLVVIGQAIDQTQLHRLIGAQQSSLIGDRLQLGDRLFATLARRRQHRLPQILK